VNAVQGQADINVEQPPRVALIPGNQPESPAIVVVWTAKIQPATALLSAQSNDGGQTFGASVPVAGTDKAAGNRGWESTAADEAGRVYVVWLDHRDTASPATDTHMVHQHGASGVPSASGASVDGVARAQESQLFVGTVGGESPPHSVARGVCYCCKTAVTTGPDGAVYAAWRHVYAGSHRDIAFTMSRDGGRSFGQPVRVSEDGWQIEGCPENGPSLAVEGQRIHVVWPTLVSEGGRETLKLFHASTSDGQTFTSREPLPTIGAAYHPQLVAAPDGTLYAAWDESETGMPTRVRLARGVPGTNGSLKFEPLDLGADANGSAPALATASNQLIVAWTARMGAQSIIAVRKIPSP
jgi:hypothetical protein